MSLVSGWKSQLVNLWAFKPFFPVWRVLKDGITFPLDYYFGDGRSRALPSIVNLNVTTVCNLDCPFCFNNDILGSREELSTEQMIDLLDQLAKTKSGLFLTGGEPFVRKDIFKIIEEAKRRKMPVGVVTNGTLLGEDDVKRLRDIGLDVVVISFHGTQEAHDKAVGHQGAFEKTLRALDLFRKYWPAPGPMINYVVTAESMVHLGDFLREVGARKNVVTRLSHLNFVTPEEAAANDEYWKRHFGEAPEKLLHFQFSPPEGLAEPVLEVLRKNPGIFTKPVLSDREVKIWYGPDFRLKRRCVFIWRSTYINSDGVVYPCQYFFFNMGNVKEQTVEQIWNSEKYRRFRALLRKGLTPGCSRCCKL